jgi:hypothetical protein
VEVSTTPPTAVSAPRARALYAGVFLVSMAMLVLEIALTRIFSFTIWYHFAYVTIGIALLGYGASGALLAVEPRLAGAVPGARLAAYAVGCGLAIVVALPVFAAVPFSPFDLARDPAHQIPSLLIYYAAATAPFFLAGLCIATALRQLADRVERLYCADLAGAGTGCVLVVFLIAGLGTPGAIVAAAVLVSAAGVCFARAGDRRGGLALTGAVVVALAGLGALRIAEFRPAPQKSLAPLLHDRANVRVSHTEWSPIFRTDVFGWVDEEITRAGGYAGWGGSVAWRDEAGVRGPKIRFITHDGDAGSPIYNFDGDLAKLDLFDHLVLKAPYVVLREPDVLVIGVGGGADILNAIVNHARHVTGIELDPVTYRQVKVDQAAFAGHLFDRPDVTVIVGEGRSALRRSTARYDLIQMSEVDTYSALSAGAYVMSESYLYTTDAIVDCLDHLTPDGLLSIVVVDQAGGAAGYPRHTMRLVTEYVEALRRRGIDDAEGRIAVVASSEPWPVVAVLLKNGLFTADETARLEAFAGRMDFPLWALPGRPLATPHAEYLRMPAAARPAYLARQDLLLTPTSDDSPFFFNFYRWRDLRRNLRAIDAGRTLATGPLLLLGMLLVSTVASALVIALPLWRRASRGAPATAGVTVFFLAIGLAFMLMEISLVQRLVLFLGYPTYALTVVLGTLLTSAGAGSMLSARLPGRPESRLLPLLATLAAVMLLDATMSAVVREFLGSPLLVRIGLTWALLLPFGLVAGMFFPTGIQLLRERQPALVPWAWGMNACASVAGTTLAVILAISVGFRAVTWIALGLYAAGVLALLGSARSARLPAR